MSEGEWRAEDPAAGYPGYPGPPPTGPYPPPVHGGPMPPPPMAPWTYPAHYPPPYLPPPAYGYIVVPEGEQRPSTLTAAIVLGYVLSGLLVVAGLVVLFGASVVTSLENVYADSAHLDLEFAFAGLANLLAAGLLIAGGVMMTNRNPLGRILFTVGNGVEIVAAIYWMARWATRDGFMSLWVWALMFTTLAVLALSLAFTSADNRWLGRR